MRSPRSLLICNRMRGGKKTSRDKCKMLKSLYIIPAISPGNTIPAADQECCKIEQHDQGRQQEDMTGTAPRITPGTSVTQQIGKVWRFLCLHTEILACNWSETFLLYPDASRNTDGCPE